MNGEKIKVGKNGHPNDTGATLFTTTYMFPADPGDTVFWNETTAGNVSFDRRGVGASGPFSIKSGQSLKLALTIVFTQDLTKQGWDDFDTFKSDVNFIQNYYDNNIDYCQMSNVKYSILRFQLKNSINRFSKYPCNF